MAKIAFVADVHIGNHRIYGGDVVGGLNTRCTAVITTLKKAIKIAADKGCKEFIVAGDLFDTDKPSPQIIKAVQDVLTGSKIDVKGRMSTSLVLGNHDMTSSAKSDNALGPLQDRADIYEGTTAYELEIGVSCVIVPFQTGPGYEWLRKDLEDLLPNKENRILVTHLGIEDEETPPFLSGAHDSIHVDDLEAICRNYGVRRVFTGNWHDHRNWEAGSDDEPIDIHQIGTLCPTGWDNPGLEGYGRVAIYDTSKDSVSFVEIPGPRFIKVLCMHGAASSDWKKTRSSLYKSAKFGNTNYLRLKTTPEYLYYFKAELQILKNSDALEEFSVLVEDSELKVAAAQAAIAAKAATTFDSSVAKYIDNMPLDDGVSRKAVLQHTMRFLKA